jgi:hypothetical protein
MMKIIKGILAEELENARHKLALYQKELSSLPKGSIVSKRIKGRLFHYLAYRNGPRMVFKYQGRLGDKDLDKFGSIQKQRAEYREFIAHVKEQIRFLERALHERKRRKNPASSLHAS